MIIYGSRSSHLKSVQLTQEHCPNCGNPGTVILSTYARYAHIFWIPIFPLGRLSVSQCQHCKQALEAKQMPAQIRAHHERNLAETKLPIWHFSGLALFMVAITIGVFANKADQEQRAIFLKNPAAGDVYEFKTEGGNYTLFKLQSVTADSVIVTFNNYEVNKITGLTQIDKEENYSDSTLYAFSRAQISAMFEAGEILDINRK